MSASERNRPSTRSAVREMLASLTRSISAHCSAVDSSIRVKVAVMAPLSLTGALARAAVRSTHQELEHIARRDRAVVDARTAGQRAAHQHGGRLFDCRLQLTNIAGRREVLVLVGDPYHLDTLPRGQPGHHRVDKFLRRRRPRGHAHDAVEIVWELLGRVDPE